MKKIVCWLVLVLVLVAPTAAQEEAAPYVMYYADAERGFIIERADGTEARYFGGGLIEDSVEWSVGATGPGWSPDGEWFAWKTWDVSGSPMVNNSFGYRVLNADGVTWATSLVAEPLYFAIWHPTRPWLLTMAELEDGTLILTVLDAPSDTLRYQDVVGVDTGEHPLPGAVWVDDTRVAVLNRAVNTLTIVDINTLAFQTYAWPEADHLMWDGEIVVVNQPDGTTEVFDVERQQPWDTDIVGNTVYYDGSTPDGEAVLLEIDDVLTMVSDGASIALPPGARQNLSLFYDTKMYLRQGWSPDSSYFLYIYDGGANLLERDSGFYRRLPFTLTEQYAMGWLEDQVVFAASVEDHVELTLHDPATAASSTFTMRTHSPQRPFINDGTLAYIYGPLVLVDMDSGAERVLMPDSRRYGSPRPGEIRWDPGGSPYFLAYEDASLVGSGGQRVVSMRHLDGDQRRELPYCVAGQLSMCGLWLPETVDVARLPAATFTNQVAQPVQRLQRDGFSFLVSWSPDGTRIAAGLNDGYGQMDADDGAAHRVDVFDVTTGEIVQTFDDLNLYTQHIVWEDDHTPVVGDAPPGWHADQGGELSPRLDVSPDGDVIARGSPVSLVDATSGEVLHADVIWFPLIAYYSSGAFSPDGTLFAAAGQIVEVASGDVVAQLPYAAHGMDFSPDGTQLAAAVSWEVQIWDVASLLD